MSDSKLILNGQVCGVSSVAGSKVTFTDFDEEEAQEEVWKGGEFGETHEKVMIGDDDDDNYLDYDDNGGSDDGDDNHDDNGEGVYSD